jgi:hypothetical protein
MTPCADIKKRLAFCPQSFLKYTIQFSEQTVTIYVFVLLSGEGARGSVVVEAMLCRGFETR